MCSFTQYRIISYVTILYHIVSKIHSELYDLISINTLLYKTCLYHAKQYNIVSYDII